MLPSTFIAYEIIVIVIGAAAAAAFIHGYRSEQLPDGRLTDEVTGTAVTGDPSKQVLTDTQSGWAR